MYLGQVHSLHYISILPLPLLHNFTVFGGFHYAVFVGIYAAYFHSLPSSVSFLKAAISVMLGDVKENMFTINEKIKKSQAKTETERDKWKFLVENTQYLR
jgi:hypothetical protein